MGLYFLSHSVEKLLPQLIEFTPPPSPKTFRIFSVQPRINESFLAGPYGLKTNGPLPTPPSPTSVFLDACCFPAFSLEPFDEGRMRHCGFSKGSLRAVVEDCCLQRTLASCLVVFSPLGSLATWTICTRFLGHGSCSFMVASFVRSMSVRAGGPCTSAVRSPRFSSFPPIHTSELGVSGPGPFRAGLGVSRGVGGRGIYSTSLTTPGLLPLPKCFHCDVLFYIFLTRAAFWGDFRTGNLTSPPVCVFPSQDMLAIS